MTERATSPLWSTFVRLRGTSTLVSTLHAEACATVGLLLLAAGSVHASTFYVTMTGIGGESDYTQRFKMWAEDIDSSLKKAGGDANVSTMQVATREQVRAKVNDLARQVKNNDTVVGVL